ncbi:MAG TPA: hypothetical protein VKO18_21940 [Terriglobia bacterium]|nr:hypothetical protein [Terriglobia bacterium]
MPKTIVVVHGVGPAEPPEIAAAVAQSIGNNTTRESTVHVEGESFVEVTDEASGDSVLVVNWSDLPQPKATAVGVLRQLLYVVTCMLDVAARDYGSDMLFFRLYRWGLFVMSPGAGLFLFSVAMGMTVPVAWERRWLLGLFFVGSAVLTYLLRPLGRHFLWLWPWTALILAVWLVACRSHPHLDWFVWLSNKARLDCFFAVIILQTLSVVQSLIRRRRLAAESQLGYCALIYLPFIAVNSLMVWLTLIGLGWLSRTWPASYQAWESSLRAGAKNFDLAHVELAATCVFTGLGLLAIVLPFLGYYFEWGAKDPNPFTKINRKGKGAQNGAAIHLAIAPVALAGLTVYLAWFTLHGHSGSALSNDTILQVYRTSVLRTLPLLAWLIGPFAVVLQVIAGVLFYLQPNPHHPAAIAERCRRRLSLALGYAGRAPGRKVIVLAHSQGSVIASDLKLSGHFSGPLVTIGSPVGSLYQRFLGIDRLHDGKSPPTDWLNAYRDGDVIAGPVTGLRNRNMGPGGHTGYWSDPELGEILGMDQAPEILSLAAGEG